MMDNRVAVVTGASKGIGAAIAEQLSATGMRVASFGRTMGENSQLLNIVCDVTDAAQVHAAFTQVESELGTPTVIIANAGITRDRLLPHMNDADWHQVIDTNLTGAYQVIRRAVRAMLQQRWGRIVSISSVVALSGSAGQANYAASKAGLIGMTRSLAKELAGKGITCNVVTPGFIETAMTAVLDDAMRTKYRKMIPAGRFGTVADVTAAVRFLVSEDASYLTGAVIPVDGGMGMGH
ncbi:MAG: 3-oxoacyl-ACP reductase FabG [Propionibacteriaceae bacterium]|jgi:3-oxoacyl-[acyl-carrier protein] reductase|nr:3-oxoacyl-ACP reductase FabG [Propionibacteriaceae bacterium]